MCAAWLEAAVELAGQFPPPSSCSHSIVHVPLRRGCRQAVAAVAAALQAVLPPLADRRLLLKPDCYTHLGIYSGNKWGLKPTVARERLPG